MSGLSDLFRSAGPRLHRRWKAELDDHVISLAWAPSGRTVAAALVSGPIALFDAATGQPGIVLKGHGFGTTAVAWRRDGSLLASAGQDGKVRLWDPATGEERAALAGGAAWVEHLTWHPSADVLASAAGKKLRLWSPDGRMLREYPDHAATISDLKWRPRQEAERGRALHGRAERDDELTSATYGGVALWSIQKSDPTRRLEWKGSILAMAWSPGGSHLAHGNQDSTVHLSALATGEDLQMAGYPMKVREVAWDPTGTYLATGGSAEATVWDCTPPGPADTKPLTFKGHSDAISALTYQAKGPLLASGGLDGKVFLFQPGRFKKALAQSEAGSAVSQLAWSPDDRALAVGTEAGAVLVYSVS